MKIANKSWRRQCSLTMVVAMRMNDDSNIITLYGEGGDDGGDTGDDVDADTDNDDGNDSDDDWLITMMATIN